MIDVDNLLQDAGINSVPAQLPLPVYGDGLRINMPQGMGDPIAWVASWLDCPVSLMVLPGGGAVTTCCWVDGADYGLDSRILVCSQSVVDNGKALKILTKQLKAFGVC